MFNIKVLVFVALSLADVISASSWPPCTSTCCSEASPPPSISPEVYNFFCPAQANPFELTCQAGQCQFPPPCGPQVCFSTQFNSQSVTSGDVVWLSAAFQPKFPGIAEGVSFTNSYVTINGVRVGSVPDSFIQLDSNLQTCSTTQLVDGDWQTVAPLPGSGNTFLSAVSIPVPNGANYANAEVTWCGDVRAPGEVDIQIAAAVYTSCPEQTAYPEACETHTNYHAGVPTGCLTNLLAGGTGGGGSNYSGSLSATYAVCKSN